mmetsp:Transcript_49300/g.89086  ORF Transcript_49300/g.89086 Transcript_49300/m.89086 type:complete len:204 (-) Transcript_49300:2755-3366(-)
MALPLLSSVAGFRLFYQVCPAANFRKVVHFSLGGCETVSLASFEAAKNLLLRRPSFLQLLAHGLLDCSADLNSTFQGSGLQDVNEPHKLTKEMIALHVGADDAPDAFATMDTNSADDIKASLSCPLPGDHNHIQTKQDHICWRLCVCEWLFCRSSYVSIPNGFHLVDLVLVRQDVKASEKIANELHNLAWLSLACKLGEASKI